MSTKNCATDNEKRKNTVECESLENPLIRIILKVSRLSPSNEIAIRKECNPNSRGQSLTLAAARVVVTRTETNVSERTERKRVSHPETGGWT